MVLLRRTVLILFSAALMLLSGCTHMIFHPNQVQYYSPEHLDVKHEEVFFKTRDGLRLHGWWLASQTPKKANIIFVHGNAQNISAHIESVAWLTKKGFDVFLFDYRGYGYSQGETELEGVTNDVLDAIAYGYQRSEKEKTPVFVLGQSLGASLAIYAVASSEYKKDIKALVTISAFSDYHKITQEVLSSWWLTWLLQWPLSFTVNNDYRPLDYIAEVSPTPVLIMHSAKDEVIPYHHAAKLMRQAKAPKKFIEIKGLHNYTFVSKQNRRQLVEYLNSFLE